jgi:hypothetical protein
MNSQEQTFERLWNYIDGLGSIEEKSDIERLIAKNKEWHRSYEELLELHKLISSQQLDAPSMRFTKNVMDQIAKYQVAPATRSYIDKKIIWGIGGFFVIMITGIVGYAFFETHWSSGKSSSDLLSQFSSKVDWSKYLTNTYINIFMMINVVLGLVLVDMYLQRKKRTSRSH